MKIELCLTNFLSFILCFLFLRFYIFSSPLVSGHFTSCYCFRRLCDCLLLPNWFHLSIINHLPLVYLRLCLSLIRFVFVHCQASLPVFLIRMLDFCVGLIAFLFFFFELDLCYFCSGLLTWILGHLPASSPCESLYLLCSSQLKLRKLSVLCLVFCVWVQILVFTVSALDRRDTVNHFTDVSFFNGGRWGKCFFISREILRLSMTYYTSMISTHSHGSIWEKECVFWTSMHVNSFSRHSHVYSMKLKMSIIWVSMLAWSMWQY